MKTLKFTARFFNHNNLHDQDEYLVQCVGYNGAYNKPSMSAFMIAAWDNRTKFGKISDSLDTSSDVQYLVSRITDESGRKNFKNAFWEAIQAGFENENQAGFDFEITQSMTDSSNFKFSQTKAVTQAYYKELNGGNFHKVFSNDILTAVSVAKLDYFDNATEESETPTQLNVARLWDEEDKKTLFYVEFDEESNWYDATTWLSGNDVKPFFSSHVSNVLEACAKLQEDVNRNFDTEWEEIYTAKGEFFNSRQNMEEKQKNQSESNED